MGKKSSIFEAGVWGLKNRKKFRFFFFLFFWNPKTTRTLYKVFGGYVWYYNHPKRKKYSVLHPLTFQRHIYIFIYIYLPANNSCPPPGGQKFRKKPKCSNRPEKKYKNSLKLAQEHICSFHFFFLGLEKFFSGFLSWRNLGEGRQ